MANLVQIYNLALAKVGHTKFVAATTDRSVEAELCNVFYEQCRNQLLREYPWRFAKRRAALSILAGTPPTAWQFQYSKPSDCLRARYLANPLGRNVRADLAVPFEVASVGDQEVIFTDLEDAELVYTQLITDPTRFDALFVIALATLMASELALPLRGKPDLTEPLRQGAEILALRATAASLNEGHEATPDTEFLGARNG